jgi:hypothetical protein
MDPSRSALAWPLSSAFNNHQLLEPIGHLPPAQAEANYDRHLASQANTNSGAVQLIHSPHEAQRKF